MYYPYNALFGRGSLNAFEAIISYSYLYMKMPAINGVITVHGDQTEARNIEKKKSISLSPGSISRTGFTTGCTGSLL
jgi:hypothetical protein